MIFSDGASRGNPGPGGWGAIVVTGDDVLELGGRSEKTTNNQMELKGAIEALKKAPKDHPISVHTDSSYVINGITKWVAGWKRSGWQTKTKAPVMNRDLWEELDEATIGHQIKWVHVGGHVGVIGNERCDFIATSFADQEPIDLYDGPLSQYGFPNIANLSIDETKAAAKSSSSSHSRAAAYSYVSMVNKKIETHRTWAECEKRVKGTKGARYKKATSPDMEKKIIQEFEVI